MKLFQKKEKQPQVIDLHEKIYLVHYSNHYKGFHIFNVVVYGNSEAEENNRKFCETGVDTSSVQFTCQDWQGERMAQLYINGLLIGSAFDQEQVAAVESGEITAIHAEIKGERLHFYAKYEGR